MIHFNAQGFKSSHSKKESGSKKHFHDKGGKKGHFGDHKSFGKHFKSGKGGGFKKGKFGVSILVGLYNISTASAFI